MSSTSFVYKDARIADTRDFIGLATGQIARIRTGMNVREYDFRLADDTLCLGLTGRNKEAEHTLEGRRGCAVRVTGELGLLPRGAHLKGHAVPAKDCEFLFVHFSRSAIEDCRYELRLPASELVPSIPYDAARIAATMRKIAGEFMDPGAGGAAFIEAMMLGLTIEVARHGSGNRSALAPQAKLSPKQLRAVRDFMANNLVRDVPLDELASVIGVSRWHFSRAFKATTGLSPHRYLEERRLDEAARLMANTRLSIIDIALSVGFAGGSQFARAFRRRRGVSPARFRAGLT